MSKYQRDKVCLEAIICPRESGFIVETAQSIRSSFTRSRNLSFFLSIAKRIGEEGQADRRRRPSPEIYKGKREGKVGLIIGRRKILEVSAVVGYRAMFPRRLRRGIATINRRRQPCPGHQSRTRSRPSSTQSGRGRTWCCSQCSCRRARCRRRR